MPVGIGRKRDKKRPQKTAASSSTGRKRQTLKIHVEWLAIILGETPHQMIKRLFEKLPNLDRHGPIYSGHPRLCGKFGDFKDVDAPDKPGHDDFSNNL